MTLSRHEIDDTALTDAATVSEKIREHEFLTKRLRDEIASLGHEHADQWVGMGENQVLVFGEKLEDIIRQIKQDKHDDQAVVVEFLSSDPMVMIL